MIEESPVIDISKYSYEVPDPEIIYNRFANSELGKALARKTRFHSFQSDKVTNRRWTETAGPDTNNLLHMLETYNLTRAFLVDNDELNDREKKILSFTAIVHDMAEVVIGDIPRPLKTKKNEAEEMWVLSGMLDHFLKEDMDEFERYNIIGDVVQILSEPESKLGRVFNAIEFVGYSKTALNCWREYRMLRHVDDEAELCESLRLLAHEVVIGDTFRLIEFSKDFPFIKDYLLQNEDYILDILNDAESTSFHDPLKLERARSVWGNFNFSNAA